MINVLSPWLISWSLFRSWTTSRFIFSSWRTRRPASICKKFQIFVSKSDCCWSLLVRVLFAEGPSWFSSECWNSDMDASRGRFWDIFSFGCPSSLFSCTSFNSPASRNLLSMNALLMSFQLQSRYQHHDPINGNRGAPAGLGRTLDSTTWLRRRCHIRCYFRQRTWLNDGREEVTWICVE